MSCAIDGPDSNLCINNKQFWIFSVHVLRTESEVVYLHSALSP